jgi:signal transduction histidine kinase/ABC-type uncharacterized transport system substrate-binding protein
MLSRFSVIPLLALCFATCVATQAAARTKPESKSVLLLYAERDELPAIHAIDVGLREALAARGGVEVFAEHFDFARFPAARYAGGLVDLLRNRYGTRKLDMVITTGYEALQFALSKRSELFPGVPITFCGIERHQLAGQTLPPDVTGAVLFYDFRRTIALALKLQPGVRDVVCVVGTTEYDRQVGREALAALADYPGLQVRRMDTVPYAEIIEQLRRLPAESMVLYVNMQRDAEGQTRFPSLVAEELSTASSVPVYGMVTHQLERGLLGGAMTDYEAHGREIGALAVARIDGQTPVPRDAASSSLLINWRALKKWRVPESRVPAEAIVRFKPPSLWQEHRRTIIGIFVVVAVQSILIAGLLINRATRRRAERALVESEGRMSLATESANLGLWVWDIARDQIWMTPRCRSMFAFRAAESLTFAAFRNRVHPDDREDMERKVRSAIDEKQPYDAQYRLTLPEGGARWIAAAGRVEYAESGEASRMHGVCRDITEWRHAQLEAQRLQHEIAHVSRVSMMGQLASALAHELNQPLGAILRNAEAAELFMQTEKPDLEEIRAILADIRTDDQRASSVIDRMRTLLKRHDLATRMLDVAELIGNVADLARSDAATRRVKLDVEVPADLPPVCGDRVHLQQVLLNLILNGMDALNGASPEHRRIIVSARVNGAQTVEIAVSDTGHGITAEKLPHVFHPFYTTKPNGMGMGLPISRTIIEAHGGRLWAESNAGAGATFRFTLPSAEKAAPS